MPARLFLALSLLALGLSAHAQSRVDDLLAAMSLRDKVGQMFMMTFFGQPLNQPARDLIREWKPGAFALFKSNLGDPATIARLTNDLQATLLSVGAPPAFIGIDQEGGIIGHLQEQPGFTRLPVPTLVTATGDPQMAYDYGQATAREMRAVGINMNFAPVADLLTNRRNPIIGRRSWGSFAEQVGPMIAAYAQGLQAEGVLATAKHFPGHGDTDDDSHATMPVVTHDLERLQRVEFAPFQQAIAKGVGAVMVSHVHYTALDEQARPASLSPRVVTGLLRETMGFDGIAMPDAMDMDAVDTIYSPAEAARLAVLAGHDLIVLGAHVSPDNHRAAMQRVLAMVERGEIDEARLDQSVRRILEAKARLGVLDWQPLEPAQAAANVPLGETAALLDRLFLRGLALVHDERGVLAAIQGGAPTAYVYPASRPNLWRACQGLSHLRPLGVSISPSEQEIAWATSSARQADWVVAFTQNAETDRAQQRFIAALPADKTLLIALWSPYDLLALPKTAAAVLGYSPLPAAERAVCAILGGEKPQGQVVVDLGS
ncbi:MAG: glycoside hydrolase family 3 protein [Anaerolineae bacterium]|nr:glycoside hydrolase family 3 protein [Anaerolineae bacterium]MDW8171526.1 glycoside hydrolase family 3 protein [Anaerolineae bacterium]